MLVNLHIKNFGIIEHLDLDFSPGFNILTGETGTGKSLIIDALQAALGFRTTVDLIRADCPKALAQAVFDVSNSQRILSRAEAAGIMAEDGLLIFSREINRNGRSPCRINGQAVTLNILKELGDLVVELTGQHQQQSLLDPRRHGELLDQFGGGELTAQVQQLTHICRRWRQAAAKLGQLQSLEDDRQRRQEILSFQIDEIERAKLLAGEESGLESKSKKLAGAEKSSLWMGQCHSALHSGHDGGRPATEALSAAAKYLEQVSTVDDGVQTWLETLKSCLYQMEDVSREIAAWMEGNHFDAGLLEETNKRLDLIKSLKKKYGPSLEDIIAFRQNALQQLNSYLDNERQRQELLQEKQSCLQQWLKISGELTILRRQAAHVLTGEITRHLDDLDMKHVEFSVNFIQTGEMSEEGAEKIEFLISANPGEPQRPLSKIASGGELSRVQLAFKSILVELEDVSTVIFDEVDSGLGGEALNSLTEKLSSLSRIRQLLCVTHSARLAAMADAHFLINKEQDGGKTRTLVTRLSPEARVEELARMLGGRNQEEAVLKHARHLLNNK